MKKKKTILGRVEMVDFPDLGIEDIPAKIDTGAYSSAIHAHKIWTEKNGEKEVLFFELFDPKQKHYRNILIKTSHFYRKKIRSSNGRLENRYFIKTPIVIGGKKRVVDLSLTNRKKMKYSLLIGRKVLKKGFLIDVSITNEYLK